jgi:hypothetical protein
LGGKQLGLLPEYFNEVVTFSKRIKAKFENVEPGAPCCT